MLRLRFRAPRFRQLVDDVRRRTPALAARMRQDAARAWRQARAHPSRALAGAVALVLVLSLVAVASLPEVRRALRDPVAAGPKATPKPKVGELPERATATSTTRRNKDGSLTTTVYSGPVNYRGADGGMHRIDSALYPMHEDGFAWRSGANAFEARFAGAAGGDVVEMRVGGRTMRMRVDGVTGARAVRAGSQVSYPGAFAGADLRYLVGPGGVKETIDLAGPNSPTSFSFRLSPVDGKAGLSARRLADGSYQVMAPPVGGAAFVLAAPVVQESAAAHTVSAPDPAAKPRLRVTQAGRDLVVTLSLDATWLKAPGRRFPVHLDPTMAIQPDAVDASFTTLSNYLPFVSDRLYIGGGDTYLWRGALSFDMGALPVDAQVTSASLGLYYDGWCISTTNTPFCGGISHPMDAHRMTAAWSTSSTSGQLAFDSTPAGSYTLPVGAPAGWMSWPVTSVVNGWVTGTSPNYGLLVKPHTEAAATSGPVPPSRTFSNAAMQPKIDVTYTSDAVDLADPATLHGNGADLSWSQYSGPSGAPFDRYEIHRKPGSAAFTPDATTLVATIRDRSVTTYRDTTAAANKTFTYRVVANSSASNPRTVTLPAAGSASKTLQPDPVAGQNTYIYYASGITNCYNYGADSNAWVGTSTNAKWRDLLAFDLRDIPVGATITNATMTMWMNSAPSVATSVQAHRITRAWKEGNSGPCTGDGATWYETQGGTSWTSQGGDVDATVAAKVDIAANAPQAFQNFTITSVVQGWVNGTTANYGVLLRTTDETLKTGNSVIYLTDDHSSTSQRPKLSVAYADGSIVQGPTVTLSAPGPGSTLSGSTVALSASASDDRRVDLVEFLVDGTPVGSDAAAPYTLTWDSASVGNGTHTLSARATDDAGNVTTSSATTVTVDNSAPPTAALSAPAAGATVGGNVSVTATASDDIGVSSVALLVDGVQVGAADETSPYAFTWKTLDPLTQAFNGSHTIAVAATDTSGQVTVSAARTVTVDNAAGTTHRATFTLNSNNDPSDDVFPPSMGENTTTSTVQDPYATPDPADGSPNGGSLGRSLSSAPVDDLGAPPPSCPVNAYCPTVNVSNASGTSWSGSQVQVWYRWYAPNGAIMYEGRSPTAFPSNFGKNGTASFPLTIYPPALPPGLAQGTFRLRIDLYDPVTATWFSANGNPPMDNPVIVAKALATKLGLERYYQYDADALGAGVADMVNVANGDLLVRWSPFYAPGRGLATMADLTYNSLEDHSSSPAGNNMSLSMSGLSRLGEPIDIHPNKADTISGRSNKWIEITDGDGTTHHFDGVTGEGGTTTWTEPAGVNLYLRSLSGDANRVWAFTRPDKVTYYYDADGFPTSVEDRNGNKITYGYETTPPGEDPGGPKKRITTVTDAGGRSFAIAYWSKAEIKKAHVRGKIKSITDHSGSVLRFDYYDDGNLLRLTQAGGTNADGTYLADRTIVFTYTTSKGDAPAIASASARLTPDPGTHNQSTRLYSVIDARAHETTYAYYQATEGAQLRWKLKSRTDRAAQSTTYAYDLTNRITTVTAPLGRTTRFGYDTSGKVSSIVNPKNETTGVLWSADNKVSQVTEPTGNFSTYTYNDNGYLTSRTNQEGERTELTYLEQAVDANDTGKHLSLLQTVTRPKGVATDTVPGDYQWRYAYDGAGNLNTVTDPTGAVTDYDYNLAGSANPGTVSAVHDANGNPPTTFPSYDPSGQPTQVVDPLGNVTRVGYDADGNVTWSQDANHAADSGSDERAYRTFFDYDSFGRLSRQSTPKSTATERGKLVWSGALFDANDNTVSSFDPHYGPVTGDPGNGAATVTQFDAMDRPTLITGPDTSVDPAGERLAVVYDAAGRTAKVTKPKGVASATVDDYTYTFGYDALDRVSTRTEYGTSTSAAQTRTSQICYDTAGDLRSVTMPNAGSAPVTCPGDGPATAGYTRTFAYDKAHRRVSQRDPLGHEQRVQYDSDGNPDLVEADITTGRVARTETDYNELDVPVTVRQLFDGASGRVLTTTVTYDKNGNRISIASPRAVDAADGATATSYVTSTDYDANNRPVRTTLPFDSRDGAERQYVHNSYDPNGNLAWTSLPTTRSDPSQVDTRAKTTMTYFDPGWIRTSDDPANPMVHADYTAQGWQSERVPERADGTLDDSLRMVSEYYSDGTLKSRRDQGSQLTTYGYDLNNNLTTASDLSGVTDPGEKPMDMQNTYTGFDELAKTRFRKQGTTTWTFTDYTYDADGNTTVRRENGEENDAGTQSKAPRRYELSYDGAGWLTQQLDLGVDSTCKDDTRTATQYWGTGQERQRDLYRAAATCSSDPTTWPKKQSTAWTHFDNGLLRTLTTTNGAGAVTESHQLDYVDANGDYVNGNRTSDHYVLARAEGNTATTCVAASPCDATWTYDARDRLLTWQQRAGKQVSYTLDEAAKLLGDSTVRAGNVTTEVDNGQTTTRRYTGNQLTDATTGGVTAKYWYTPLGSVDCVTTASGTQANCSPGSGATPSNLVADYGYDYLNRLTSVRQYAGTTLTDEATYVYDALDRTVREVENHTGTGNDRTTTFSYQGITSLVTQEQQVGGTNPKTKTYSYDSYGHRLGMTDTDGAGVTTSYTYGNDVHGSVSQLIDDAGKVKASYGYDPYGGQDAPSTDTQSLTTGDTNAQAPVNPMRYAGRRMDSGTANSAGAQAGYDMGARRFGPDTTRFLQADAYASAIGDLGLGMDPLTQNRYALAGGNPVSYVEVDGHMLVADGGGGGSTTTNPTNSTATGGGTQKKTRTGADCAERLDCTVDDFNKMSLAERKDFVNQFMNRYGTEWRFSGWYNQVYGVLRFMSDSGVGATNSWASWVDSTILNGFERGLAMAMGRPGGDQGNPGASKWKRFFIYSRSNDADDDSDMKRRLWSEGEEASTQHGYAVAFHKGGWLDKLPNSGEAAFALAAHGYRFGLRHQAGARTAGAAAGAGLCGPILAATCARIGSDAAQDVLDPHTDKPTYYGAHVFNGLGRAGAGDPGGLAEAARYGAEGLGEAGKWLWNEVF
jgi:RHS repeat-associated protein